MADVLGEHPFSLTQGGPWVHVLRRCHLVDEHGRARWGLIALIAWVPIVVASVVQLIVARRLDPLLSDPTMHVRLLVTVPLVLLADHLLDARCETAVHHVRKEGIADRGSLEAIVARAEHIRDLRFFEICIALIVLLLGQTALWRFGGWGGVVSGHKFHSGMTFATVWCVGVALPLVQFLMLRWLWHWAIWTYVLARLSRLSLSLNAIHPDQAAGLRILTGPIDAFAVFGGAIASAGSVAWMVQVHEHRATLQSITPLFLAAFAAIVAVACVPLLLFSPQLYRARHRDCSAYHALARDYVDKFRRKWLDTRPNDLLLGTADIQALDDLGQSFKRADETRLYAFTPSTLARLWVGTVLPMVPLVIVSTPVNDVVKHFGIALFGFPV